MMNFEVHVTNYCHVESYLHALFVVDMETGHVEFTIPNHPGASSEKMKVLGFNLMDRYIGTKLIPSNFCHLAWLQ